MIWPMSYDSSADTLVFELRFPAGLGVLVGALALAGVLAVAVLPLPVWVRVLLSALVAGYAATAVWIWWRRMPARLAITGDGRCRGHADPDGVIRYGVIRDGLVRRRFVVVRAGRRRGRFLLVTRGMVSDSEFRRLRSRLRTVMPQ